MNDSWQKLNKKLNEMSLNNLLGLYLLAGLLVAGIIGYFMVRPTYSNAQATKQERAQIEQRNQSLENLIDRTEQLKANYEKVEDERDRILSLLPTENEEQYLVALLGDLAQESGVVMTNFRPETIAGETSAVSEDETGTYESYRATVNLSGSYEAIIKFLDELEQSSRFIEVQSFTASAGAGGAINDSALNLILTFEAYYQTIDFNSAAGEAEAEEL